jgi:spore germination cell wall hydrolase CwlJ-like protein
MKPSLFFGACALAFLGGLVTGKSAFAENYQAEEVKCLADNIYWEARNQTVKGMFAVGHVTINRVKDSRFPNTVCEVVYQGPTRPSWKDKTKYYPVKNRCQFSWYCDGKADVILKQDEALYDLILMMSFKIYSGKLKDLTDGATHYHADYVRPEWASSKTKTMKIGQHIFYRWEK